MKDSFRWGDDPYRRAALRVMQTCVPNAFVSHVRHRWHISAGFRCALVTVKAWPPSHKSVRGNV
jgi:hypothetical protein